MTQCNESQDQFDKWKPINTAPRDRSVILGASAPFFVTYIGRKRYGNLGEPSMDTFAWRCDSSGRFSSPTHWQESPEPPKQGYLLADTLPQPVLPSIPIEYDGDGVPRFGIYRYGKGKPFVALINGGYWTPWHMANTEFEILQSRLGELCMSISNKADGTRDLREDKYEASEINYLLGVEVASREAALMIRKMLRTDDHFGLKEKSEDYYKAGDDDE